MKLFKQNLLLLLLLMLVSNTYAVTRYVNRGATGANNGTSWANAYTNLQVAMNAAAVGDEIWVAAGTYKPTMYPDPSTTADPQTKSFYLNKNIKIYGGFNGTETALSQRDWVANLTILSGDIGTVGDNTDNCNHVFITTGLTAAAVIDGFTVKDGYAINWLWTFEIIYAGVIFSTRDGGGFFNYNSSPTLTNLTVSGNTASGDGGGFCNANYSSPILTNVIVSGNTTTNGGGGGFANFGSSPILTNVIVSGNTADWTGGGFYNVSSSPTLTNVNVSGNTAGGGGGFRNVSSSPTLTNVTVSGNTATYWGGGGFENIYSSPTLTNVTVSGNTAYWDGGGFYNENSSPTLTNVTVSGNTASSNGGGFYNYYYSSPIIKNSIIWNNGSSEVYNYNGGGISTPIYSYCIIKGSGGSGAWNSNYGIDGGNNLAINPLFVSATNLSLQTNSPAIDAGNNAFNTTTTDLAGNSRICCFMIDMGAYEVCNAVVLNETICQGASYTFGSSVYNTAGTYTNLLQTWQGCDSTVTLNLVVRQNEVTTLNETICQGDAYTVGSSVYTTAGTYTNLLQTQYGCDSTVTLNLTVNPNKIFRPSVNICQGDAYTVGDSVYTKTGTYTNFLETWQGCDSMVVLNLMVYPPVTMFNAVVNDGLNVPLASIDITPVGGTFPYTYAWSNGAVTQDIDSIWGGTYEVSITDATNCTYTFSFEVGTVNTHSVKFQASLTAKVYPNPIYAGDRVTLSLEGEANQILNYDLTDALGRVLQQERLEHQNQISQHQIVMPNAAGVYFLRLHQEGNAIQTLPILVK